MNWHGFGGYGMGGWTTDPAEYGFSERVNHELGVNIHGSPYRDYEAAEIAGLIKRLSPGEGIFLWGSSLMANNLPYIATLAQPRPIAGIFGFQASSWPGAAKVPVPKNVLFAQLFTSNTVVPLPALGSYQWVPGEGFPPESLHITHHNIPHPGDYDVGDQNTFLAEMKRIMESAG